MVDGVRVVVVKSDGEFFAFENNCPHQHSSVLHQGTVDSCTITCPMHGWTFDMRTGTSTNGNGKLRMAVIKIEEGALWMKDGELGHSFVLFDAEGAP